MLRSISAKKAAGYWVRKTGHIRKGKEIKEKPVSGLKRKNRGARGDSLRMLSPSGLSNKKPPLLNKVEVGGVCHETLDQ